jgi:outer membrane protein assembly factor BamB
VADGAVYIGTNAGALYGIDAVTGEQRWQFDAGGTIWAAPAYADGTVFVGSWDTNVYAIDAASGMMLWKFAVEGPIFAATAVVDGKVYVSVQGNNNDVGPSKTLYALDATNGQVAWTTSFMPETDVGNNESAFAIADGVVYIERDQTLFAFDAATGDELSRSPVLVNGLARSTLGSGAIYFTYGRFGSERNALLAVDTASGRQLWDVTVGAAELSWPVVTGGMIYVGDAGGVLYALGADQSVPASPQASPPAQPPPNST